MASPLVFNRYIVGRKLGAGSFGQIFECEDNESDKIVAAKIEDSRATKPQLEHEWMVCQKLGRAPGFPRMICFGKENNFNVIVMELLGPNLEELFDRCSRNFSLKTVIMIAEQILTRIQRLHSHGFIHRDIKPDNFVIGRGDATSQLYMIDFGLSQHFRNAHTKAHLPCRNNKRLTGTARYASVNAHAGVEQSRRDDLESLGYLMVYFLKGGLPWQNQKASTKEKKFEKIYRIKKSIPIDDLCKDLPTELADFIKYCRKLTYSERPQYDYLHHLFRKITRRFEFIWDMKYDWPTRT